MGNGIGRTGRVLGWLGGLGGLGVFGVGGGRVGDGDGVRVGGLGNGGGVGKVEMSIYLPYLPTYLGR